MSSQVVLVVKNLPAKAGDIKHSGLIPGSGRAPGEGHSNPFQYSCLENPMDRGAQQAMVYRVTKSQRQLKATQHTPTMPSRFICVVVCVRIEFFFKTEETWHDNAGDGGDVVLIPGSERSPGGGSGNPLQYSYWETPWTEEPGGLQSIRLKRVGQD